MADNKYVVEYARTGRSSCKDSKCKQGIAHNALRIGKLTVNPFDHDSDDFSMVQWYHASCMFRALTRARKSTKRIADSSDLEGFSAVREADQKFLKRLMAGQALWNASGPPRSTAKKRKHESDGDTDSDSESDSETAPTARRRQKSGVVKKAKKVPGDASKRRSHKSPYEAYVSKRRCYKLFVVPKAQTMQEFIEDQGMSYTQGNGYYLLSNRAENVNFTKRLVLIEKASEVARVADREVIDDKNIARRAVGIPTDRPSRINTSNCHNSDRFHIFIQSTSGNRSLRAPTKLLYEVSPRLRQALLEHQNRDSEDTQFSEDDAKESDGDRSDSDDDAGASHRRKSAAKKSSAKRKHSKSARPEADSSDSDSTSLSKRLFAGLKFAITGALPGYTRNRFNQLVLSKVGGILASSVTSRVDFLITTPSYVRGQDTSKLANAKAMGIKIISHMWIVDSMSAGRKLPLASKYILAGESGGDDDDEDEQYGGPRFRSERSGAKRKKTKSGRPPPVPLSGSESDSDDGGRDHRRRRKSRSPKKRRTAKAESPDYLHWDVDSTLAWLISLDSAFEKYSGAFKKEQVSGEMLPELDHSILKEDLGVAAFEHRRRILKAIRSLKERKVGVSTQGPSSRSNSSPKKQMRRDVPSRVSDMDTDFDSDERKHTDAADVDVESLPHCFLDSPKHGESTRLLPTTAFPHGMAWSKPDTWLHVLSSPEVLLSPTSKDKVIAFDLDWTLVQPKGTKKFPQDRSDWKWMYACIPKRLRVLYRMGCTIVIFSNQRGIERGKQRASDVEGKILDMAKELGFPVIALLAAGPDKYRKPMTGMWDYYVKELRRGVSLWMDQCVYVGDAAGRAKGWKPGAKRDFNVTDRKFAANVGLRFATPDEFFLSEPPAPFHWRSLNPAKFLREAAKVAFWDDANGPIAAGDRQELVVFVGMPASGKSTFAKRYLAPHGYVIVNRDTVGDSKKCVKLASEAMAAGKSVAIDNTNPSAATRAEYCRIAAKKKGVRLRCFWFQTSQEVAKHLNQFRMKISDAKRIPDVAYNMFHSRFEEPTRDEFDQVCKVECAPRFKSKREKELFLEWTD